MPALNPYLIFNGNTEEAFNFYKSIFGGEFLSVQRFKDSPGGDKFSPSQKEKLMHISLPIGKGSILMASDALESKGYVSFGNNFQLSVEVESKEEAEKIFKELSAGAKIEMPIADTFWGAYFGMLTDKFGIEWMVSYTYKK